MKTKAIVAGGAIAVLAGGSALLLDRLTSAPQGGPAPAAPPAAPQPGPDLAPGAPAPPPPTPAPAADLDLKATRAAIAQAQAHVPVEPPQGPPPVMPPAPPVATWAKVEIANPHGEGSMGPAIMAALAKLKPALAECYTPAGQARYAQLGDAASKLPGGNVKRHVGPAIVLLSLQGDGSELEIVDAPVESRGAASDGTLNCAQAKLRGAKLPVVTEGPVKTRFRYLLRP